MTKVIYKYMSTFQHIHTGETMYRIKMTFESGGVMYGAYTGEELKIMLGYKEYCRLMGYKIGTKRPVIMCHLDGTEIERFDSIKAAAMAMTRPTKETRAGARPKNYMKIYNAVNGHRGGIAYGYKWKYAD